MSYDEDTPNELLLRELVASPAWIEVKRRLLERRDQWVASLVQMKPDASAGEIQRYLGYIRAMNEIAATPEKLLEKANPEKK